MKGRILKGVGGFYYVQDKNGTIHECKARGRFRLDETTPVAGDYVQFTPQVDKKYGFIEEIEPRDNILLRPPVANLDTMLLVVAAAQPQIDYMLCDKLLVQAERAGIESLVCINKIELDSAKTDSIAKQYNAYDTFQISVFEDEGFETLNQVLRERTVAFAGQSAVGKSSIINHIGGKEMDLEIGDVSERTERGKHTTRVVELLYLKEQQAYVFDTPGFSMFDIAEMEEDELGKYYREFQDYMGQCKFSTCVHDKEPGCAIKEAVQAGDIDENRYKRYIKIKNSLEGIKW